MTAVRILINIPYFSELTIGEVIKLVERSETRVYPCGSVILNKGDAGEVLYVILKGRVKIVLSHPNGKEIIVNVLKAGDFFGEMAIFDEMPRSATVVAAEDCEFLIISRKIIIDLIKKTPPIAFKLLSDMSRRVREADEQIFSLANLDAKGRVAQTLLRLSNESGMVTDEGYRVFSTPSLKDLAAMSGTSRELVSELISELSKRGIIGLSEDYIIVFDRFETKKDTDQ